MQEATCCLNSFLSWIDIQLLSFTDVPVYGLSHALHMNCLMASPATIKVHSRITAKYKPTVHVACLTGLLRISIPTMELEIRRAVKDTLGFRLSFGLGKPPFASQVLGASFYLPAILKPHLASPPSCALITGVPSLGRVIVGISCCLWGLAALDRCLQGWWRAFTISATRAGSLVD